MFLKNFIMGMILAGTIAVSGTASVSAIKSDETIRNTPGLVVGSANCSPMHPGLVVGSANCSPMHPGLVVGSANCSPILKSALDGLVKKGTITKEQEEAVIKAMAAKRERLESKKGKNAPDDQKRPCKDEKCKHHEKKHGVLNELVEDGIITREQAASIREAIKSARDAAEKQKQ